MSTKSLAEFVIEIKKKNPDANLNLIEKAYKYALVAHTGQKRKTGEDFFEHPFAVAGIIVENDITDTATICGALLHDIVEDTSITVEEVAEQFSEEIARIVDGVTKVDKRAFESLEEYKEENIRKIILATARDPRVIIIKLADRLHNMRTLMGLDKERQIAIANETLQIYAPLADKLGLSSIKGELQDNAFRYLNNKEYYHFKEVINLTRIQREENVIQIAKDISDYLKKHHIKATVKGRAKYFYSIYRKMQKKGKSFDEINDLYGIRIIVEKEEECYHALELLKEKWTDVPNLFKDYIKNPKRNGYQSIHSNIEINDILIELQIRTYTMDNLAESGAATHWKYKQTEKDKKFDQKINWVRQFLSWVTSPEKSISYRELMIDVFKNQIIVLTPDGDPITLPEGATPVDFAFAVHTSVGEHAVRATINGEPVSLNSELESGEIVTIVTSPHRTVSASWLKFAKSSSTIAKIKKSLNIEVEQKSPQKKMKKEVQHKSFREEVDTIAQLEKISGNTPIKISKCCNPQKGNKIVAFYTRDRKLITVHKADCPNQFALDQRLRISLKWSTQEDEEGQMFTVVAKDRGGIIIDILNIMEENNLPLKGFISKERKENVHINLELERVDPKICDKVMDEIKKIDGVIQVIKQIGY